ncbi:hypothetical protein G4B88_025181 [Cannabis sativa]|uniref:Uncharacterized protein n=1 Tax=Cannabis sativa TaxID=3483 RepID=A0A7J6EG31_CANSA|nr:hypothetical protein G4B88_025181 [Cannabis sativa]
MVEVMTTKRKYKSGALKRKEKSKKEILLKKQVGSLNKYFGNNKVETSITNAIEDELDCENNVNEVKDQVVNDKEEELQNNKVYNLRTKKTLAYSSKEEPPSVEDRSQMTMSERFEIIENKLASVTKDMKQHRQELREWAMY